MVREMESQVYANQQQLDCEITHFALAFADVVDSLPASLTRALSDLKELDAVLSGPLKKILQKLNHLLSLLEVDPGSPGSNASPAERLKAIRDVAEDAKLFRLGGEDRVRVAGGASEGLIGNNLHLDLLATHIIQRLPAHTETSLPSASTPRGYPHVYPPWTATVGASNWATGLPPPSEWWDGSGAWYGYPGMVGPSMGYPPMHPGSMDRRYGNPVQPGAPYPNPSPVAGPPVGTTSARPAHPQHKSSHTNARSPDLGAAIVPPKSTKSGRTIKSTAAANGYADEEVVPKPRKRGREKESGDNHHNDVYDPHGSVGPSGSAAPKARGGGRGGNGTPVSGSHASGHPRGSGGINPLTGDPVTRPSSRQRADPHDDIGAGGSGANGGGNSAAVGPARPKGRVRKKASNLASPGPDDPRVKAATEDAYGHGMNMQFSADSPQTYADAMVDPGAALDQGPQDGEDKVYCFCEQQGAGGTMIGCDSGFCEREWFHIDCVGLSKPPSGVWYCDECKAKGAGAAAGPTSASSGNGGGRGGASLRGQRGGATNGSKRRKIA